VGADPGETASVDDARGAACGSCIFAAGGAPGPGPPRNQAGGSRLAHNACARRACVDERFCAAYHAVSALADGARASLEDDRDGELACFTGAESDDFLRAPDTDSRTCTTRCCGSAAADPSRGA